MKAAAASRREQIRAMLADLKMPGALEAVDGVLPEADSGGVTTSEAIEKLLGAQINLRNNRRLQAAMRSSRLPTVKTIGEFDFSFQPSIKREQIESLHELGFVERKENVVLLGPLRCRQDSSRDQSCYRCRPEGTTRLLRHPRCAHHLARGGSSCRNPDTPTRRTQPPVAARGRRNRLLAG